MRRRVDRARKAMNQMEDTLHQHPEAADRTSRMLTGKLPAGRSYRLVDNWVALKLSSKLLARVDRLVPYMANDPAVADLVGRITKATVVRQAVHEGIAAMELALSTNGMDMPKRPTYGEAGQHARCLRFTASMMTRIETVGTRLVRAETQISPTTIRGLVVRAALLQGLDVLEKRYRVGK